MLKLINHIIVILFLIAHFQLYSQIKELNYSGLKIEVLQSINENPDTLYGGMCANTLNGCIISNKSTYFKYRKKGVGLSYNESNKLSAIEVWKKNDLFIGYNVGSILYRGEMRFDLVLYNQKLHYVFVENKMSYYCSKRILREGLIIKRIIYNIL